MPDNHESNDSSDYEVGYGKPPKHTRFKQGQSGNPKGRPKKDRAILLAQQTMREQFFAAALRLVPIVQNGKKREIPAFEAVLHQLVAKAASGNMPAIRLLIEELERHLIDHENIAREFYQMMMRKEEADDEAEFLQYIEEQIREERRQKKLRELERLRVSKDSSEQDGF